MTGLSWARCPHCAQPLRPADGALRCESGHTFDIARQGYVNLVGTAPPANADSAAMLDARARFLATGHYDEIAEKIADLAVGERVAEVGAGTAFYLSRVLDRDARAQGLATDISTAAARRAARAHPRIAAIVADTWRELPIQTGCLDALVCVFAPRNMPEFARILRPGARLVVAQPLPEHLAGIRNSYGLLDVPADKDQRLRSSLEGWEIEAAHEVRYTARLTPENVADLIAMGPNAFHTLPDHYAPADVEVAVQVVTARPPLAA